jgi:hypothetical protein
MRLVVAGVIALAIAACGGGKDEFELHMTAEIENTSRLCGGTGIQYCLDSKPASGQLTGRLDMGNPPHLFVRKGCEGDGERVGDSVFVNFAAASVPGGTCYTFNIRARIDGDRISGRWGEGKDGHGGGITGTLEGFRN